MKHFLVTTALLAALAPGLRAITTYNVDNTGGTCVSSQTIHASDSGMTSAHYAVTVYDGTSRVPTSHYTATIDTSSYDLALTFSSTYFPSGHCGLIKLRGMYGASDTSSANDFVVTASDSDMTITVSVNGSYSQRTVSGVTYASDVSSTVGTYFSDHCQGELYVYFASGTGQLTAGSEIGPECISTYGSKIAAAYSPDGFPTGAVPLFRIANTGSALVMDGDYRPW
jgi:hypothetical protein